MNLAEYFLPIIQLEKKINDLRTRFASTLNTYLPEGEQIELELPEAQNGAVETVGDGAGSPKMNLSHGLNFLQGVIEEVADKDAQDDDPSNISIRKYQAISSNLLNGDKPNILEAYMELVIQFGYIILFAEIFPLGALMSLISNLIQVQSQVKNLKYLRRFEAEVSNGIGSWMLCLQTLSQLSIFMNCFTVYFTSKVYYKLFVEGDEEIQTLTAGWDAVKFLLLVIIVEHGLLLFKIFLEQTIEDCPDFVVKGQVDRSTLINNFKQKAIENEDKMNGKQV